MFSRATVNWTADRALSTGPTRKLGKHYYNLGVPVDSALEAPVDRALSTRICRQGPLPSDG